MTIERYNVTLEKKHEGKTLYAYPTGNNYSRYHENKLLPVEVIKVKRKYAELRINTRHVNNYCIKEGYTQDSFNANYTNSGYRWYESVEEYEKERALNEKLSQIVNFLDHLWENSIEAHQIETIHKTLFTEDKTDA